jgi:hypothetical protein
MRPRIQTPVASKFKKGLHSSLMLKIKPKYSPKVKGTSEL